MNRQLNGEGLKLLPVCAEPAQTLVYPVTVTVSFFEDPTPFLGSAVQILISLEQYKAASVLAEGEWSIVEQSVVAEDRHTETNWHYYAYIHQMRLDIALDILVYTQLNTEKEQVEKQIFKAIGITLNGYNFNTNENEYYLINALVKIRHQNDPDWQKRAKATLKGEGVTNQGRVRSDNIASIVHQGLLFRSQSEVKLFDALKRANILFAPLPVFIKSSNGNRIEPDFIVIDDGITLLIEVDGSTYHRETPIEAQERLKEFTDAGINHYRVNASDCMTDASADAVAQRIIDQIALRRRHR